MEMPGRNRCPEEGDGVQLVCLECSILVDYALHIFIADSISDITDILSNMAYND